jgi:hypothetical protein
MPSIETGSLSGSTRVGFTNRTWTIPAPTATLDINGNRPIRIYSIAAAASGQGIPPFAQPGLSSRPAVTNNRGFIVTLSGGGLGSTLTPTGRAFAANTFETGSHTPAVANFAVSDTTVVPTGSFTMTYTGYLNDTTGGTNNNVLETNDTFTRFTDDLRIGINSGVSANYWGSYSYYMVPDAPSIVGASSATGSASISWTTPANGGAGITSYTVEYSTTSNFSSNVFSTSTTATSVSVSVGYATWYFRVYANNAVGSSQRSGTQTINPPAPVFTSFGNTNPAIRGVGYSKIITASNANSNGYSVVAGSLPPGLTLSTAGNISGTPTTISLGTQFNFTVRAVGLGGSVDANISITVNPPTPAFTTPAGALAVAIRGSSYSFSLIASDVASYSLASGTVPTGLTLNSNGTITGTATVLGTYSFTARATNVTGNVTRNFNITVNNPAPVFTTPAGALPIAIRGSSYSSSVSATNATSYSLASGSLPPGIGFNSNGTITGTATALGTYSFTARATNVTGSSDRSFSITANPPTPVFTDQTVVSSATRQIPYQDQVSATDASSYSVFSGSLPTGLTLNTSTGVIGRNTAPTQAPTVAGTFSFVIRATNVTGSVNTGTLTIIVKNNLGRRYTGTDFANIETVKRFNGTTWVTSTLVKRFNGTAWVDVTNT